MTLMITVASMKFQTFSDKVLVSSTKAEGLCLVLIWKQEMKVSCNLHLLSHGKVQMRNHFLWSRFSSVIRVYDCWCQREEFHIKESHDTASKVYGFIVYNMGLKYLYKNKALTHISMYKCCHFLLFSPRAQLHDCFIGQFIALIIIYVLAKSVDPTTSNN